MNSLPFHVKSNYSPTFKSKCNGLSRTEGRPHTKASRGKYLNTGRQTKTLLQYKKSPTENQFHTFSAVIYCKTSSNIWKPRWEEIYEC